MDESHVTGGAADQEEGTPDLISGADEGRAMEADPLAAAREALRRARAAARARGLRPGRGSGPRVGAGAAGRALAGRARVGRDGRDPQLVGERLEQVLAERGWNHDLSMGSVMGRWSEIVGPAVAEHARPVGFEGSVLTVQADSTAWATQLRLLGSTLLGRIEDVAGPGVVTEVTVLGPNAPAQPRGRLRVKGPGPRDTWG